MTTKGETWQRIKDGAVVYVEAFWRKGGYVEYTELFSKTGFRRDLEHFLKTYRLLRS